MIAIIGAGGHARAVYDCLFASGEQVLGFFDDDPRKQGKEVIDGRCVLGPLDAVAQYRDRLWGAFVALGDNALRLRYFQRCLELGLGRPDARHPKSYISPFARTGPGLFLMGAAMINAGARVGDAVIINTNATVGHDCVIGDAAQVGPGVNIGGGAVIGELAFIGIGARIAPSVTVGAGSVVGAGAVVLRDVPPRTFVCGVPARIKRSLD